MRRLVGAWAIATVVSLVACGGSSPAIEASAARDLADRMATLRTAVEQGDAEAAAAALDALERDVVTFRDQGDISPDRADEILAAASRVSALLAQMPAPSPSPSVAVSSSGEDQGHDPQGEANGHDEEHPGKGHGED